MSQGPPDQQPVGKFSSASSRQIFPDFAEKFWAAAIEGPAAEVAEQRRVATLQLQGPL